MLQNCVTFIDYRIQGTLCARPAIIRRPGRCAVKLLFKRRLPGRRRGVVARLFWLRLLGRHVVLLRLAPTMNVVY